MNILKTLRKENIDELIDDILIEFYKKLSDWKKNLKIDGKNIEKANVEQASWMAYYDEIKVQVRALLEFYEMKVKESRSKALKNIIQHSAMDHGERAREKLIDSDPTYIKYIRIYLEIKELYNLLESISDQIRNRAFALNNIVKIRIAQMEDVTLYE